MPTVFKACKNCADRTLGCHSNCERYLEDKAKNEQLKAARERDLEIRRYKADVKMKNIEINHKKKKHHAGYGHRSRD